MQFFSFICLRAYKYFPEANKKKKNLCLICFLPQEESSSRMIIWCICKVWRGDKSQWFSGCCIADQA